MPGTDMDARPRASSLFMKPTGSFDRLLKPVQLPFHQSVVLAKVRERIGQAGASIASTLALSEKISPHPIFLNVLRRRIPVSGGCARLEPISILSQNSV